MKTKILLLTLLFWGVVTNAANISSTGVGGLWSATTTWVGGVVPLPNDNVTVVAGSNVTADVNITVGTGTYTFNGNVTDNGIHTLTVVTGGGSLIISNSSTTTFGGAASWDNSTITVNAGSTLIVGPLTIDNGTAITIAGTLIVNGDVLDRNNGGGSSFNVTGYVQIYGNYASPVGSVSVSGSGVFQTTGTISTQGSSTVGGSTNNCTTGPCSSGSIGCGTAGSSFTSSVSPTNHVLCSGQTISPISFTTGTSGPAVLSYQWQISTTSGGTGFSDIGSATSSSYTPPQPSVTTWYRMRYSLSGCSGLISPSSQITVSSNPPPAITNMTATVCSAVGFTSTPVNATNGVVPAGTTYTWPAPVVTGGLTGGASGTAASSITGTLTNPTSTAQTATYTVTPSSGICKGSTFTVTVTVNAAPATPGAITQPPNKCSGSAGNAFSITAVAGATSYTWAVTGTGWSVTTNGTINGIITIGTGSGTVSVTATNSCSTSMASTTGSIAVTANNTAGIASSTPTLCISTLLTNITHTTTGATGISNSGVSGANGLPAGVSATWATNTITISGTPTASGTFNYSIPLTGGCGAINATGTITVTANNTAGVASSTPTLCINTVLTNITRTTTGATGISNSGVSGANGLPAGVSATWATNTITISGTPTASGVFSYSIPLTGGCGTVNATGTITVTASPAISSQSTATQTKCIALAFLPITVTATGASLTYQWYSNATASNTGGTTLGSANGAQTNSYTPQSATVGTLYYYCVVTGTCGSSITTAVSDAFTVVAAPVITPNKVDGTCTFANGTISPTLSGGLTNVQYIKLTQKFVNPDAWQQVAEIEAFEIFTGTNVALATNGATATSSSDYSPLYLPPSAIDGNNGGNNNFWHSGTTNVGEWIKVDLTTAKNLDYIKIYNRTDCCQFRGQNMLLELFDASNNLLYSKTVDLYQGINGVAGTPVFVNANVLDVSWADAATTLNRTGLSAGTYTLNYTADAAGCTTSLPITISNPTPASWNGTVWAGTASTTTPPLLSQPVTFTGPYTSSGSLNGCSCTINSGVAVIISSGDTLTITNQVAVNTAAGTSLIFNDTASLVQTNDAAINTGVITYKRNTQPMLRYDFTDWSSPVASQNLNAFSPATLGDKYFSYNSVVDNWSAPLPSLATTMEVGRGYIIRAPQTYAITGTKVAFPGVFTGVPNNGVIPSHSGLINAGKSCLIGNPYPSAISVDLFLATNSTKVAGTIYIWTHNTPPAPYKYTSNDYASYNGVGGTATLAAASGGATPTGFIAAGQSFFATGAVGAVNATASFNNSMRVATTAGATGNNVQFFRMGNKTKQTTAIEKSRIWLNMSNTTGTFRQTLLGYVTGATNGIDSAFDGPSFSASTIDFYSINESKNLVIQGRALPFDTADEVPLGYSSTTAGDFTISIDQTDGLLANQDIFLEDKDTGTTQNLKDGAYNFTTDTGTFDTRFVLKYTNGTTLGTNTIDAKENKVIVSAKNKQIKINAINETIDKVTVYDLLGKRIYQKANIGTSELLISNINPSQTVLIVKTTLKNGQTSSKKVIFE
jgi:hypothetical protein